MAFKNDSDHLDQHFLKDKKIVERFIKEANLTKDDVVVEIGPGKGTLSQIIASKVKKLYCIELDERLRTFLDPLMLKYDNVEIIYGNALDIMIPCCSKIVTVLPYSIVEPFIHKIIKCQFDEILMITGKKFATNIEDKEITMLSLLTNCYFSFEKIMDIPKEAFEPAPRVMSTMIKLKPLKKENITSFSTFVFRYLFYYKNKHIKNALVESLIKTYEQLYKETLTQRNARSVIEALDLDEVLLKKKFEVCSNEELNLLYMKIEMMNSDVNKLELLNR